MGVLLVVVIDSRLLPGLDPLEARLAAASLGAAAVALALALRPHRSAITKRVEPPVAFYAALEREFTRSRRHQRPVAVVRVTAATPEERRISMVELREEDRAWWQDGFLYLLLPETDRSGAETCAVRLQRHLGDGALHAAFAAFPADALTARGLLASFERPSEDSGRGAA